LVVGEKVVGGMLLTAVEGSLVTNTATGGTTEYLDNNEILNSWKIKAVKAAKSLGMECCSGVDILVGSDGKVVILEANDGPKISTAVDEHGANWHKLAAQALVNKVQGKNQAIER